MAELFIELFSEEIPSKLQIDARQKIQKIIEEKLSTKELLEPRQELWTVLMIYSKLTPLF